MLRLIRLGFTDSSLEYQAPLMAIGILDVDTDGRIPSLEGYQLLKGEALTDSFDLLWDNAAFRTILAHGPEDQTRISRLRLRWLGLPFEISNGNADFLSYSMAHLGSFASVAEVCALVGLPMPGDIRRAATVRGQMLCSLLTALLIEILGWDDGRDVVSSLLLESFDGCGLPDEDRAVAVAYAALAVEQVRFLRFTPPPRLHEIEF